jgi:hypothetical protein
MDNYETMNCVPDFDRSEAARWLGWNCSAEELARRLLALTDLVLSPTVEREVLHALSSFGPAVMGRELARSALSLSDLPDYESAFPPAPPGSLAPGGQLRGRVGIGVTTP